MMITMNYDLQTQVNIKVKRALLEQLVEELNVCFSVILIDIFLSQQTGTINYRHCPEICFPTEILWMFKT